MEKKSCLCRAIKAQPGTNGVFAGPVLLHWSKPTQACKTWAGLLFIAMVIKAT